MSSLSNIFDSQLTSFPTSESKIRYTLTFLTGNASNWRKLLLKDVTNGHFSFNSWDSFEKRFRDTFGNPHLVEEAHRKLWTIKQGQRTSEDFFLKFEEIRLEAGLCEQSLIMFLQAALRSPLLDEVLRCDPQPSTYSEWKTAILKADHNQRNSTATRSFHSNTSSQLFSHRPNNPFPFCPRQTTSSTNPQLQQQPSSTTVDNKPKTAIPSYSNTVPKAKTCWKCGKVGHISKDCLENSANPKVRALFDQFDALNAAYEATSSGIEVIRGLLESDTEILEDDCRTFLERFVSEHPVFVEYDE